MEKTFLFGCFQVTVSTLPNAKVQIMSGADVERGSMQSGTGEKRYNGSSNAAMPLLHL